MARTISVVRNQQNALALQAMPILSVVVDVDVGIGA